MTSQISVKPDSWLGHQGAKTVNTKMLQYHTLTDGWIIYQLLAQLLVS
jgi:hypothetical protein